MSDAGTVDTDACTESDAGTVCRTKHVFQVKQLTSPASEHEVMRISHDPTPSKPRVDTYRELTSLLKKNSKEMTQYYKKTTLTPKKHIGNA